MTSTIINVKPVVALASQLHLCGLRRLFTRTLWPGRRTADPPPTGTPYERTVDRIEPADAYGYSGPVWVNVGSSWHHGFILYATRHAALVCYQVPGGGGIGVENVPASHLARRHEPTRLSARTAARVAQARVTLLMHHADRDGLCAGHAQLAQFCWFPCPDAKAAMADLADCARHQLRRLP